MEIRSVVIENAQGSSILWEHRRAPVLLVRVWVCVNCAAAESVVIVDLQNEDFLIVFLLHLWNPERIKPKF